MFTGIITDVGDLQAVTPRANNLHRLRIACVYPADSIDNGASIACSGVCLTVVAKGSDGQRNWFEVDAAAETLAVTTAKDWKTGTRLNLERALKIGDELGGHLVSGHVDGIAEIVTREETGGAVRFVLRAPPGLSRFIATKGSVALDGASLTVNSVDRDLFSVLLIPHTLKVTTLAAWQSGSAVNLEVDQMARYAARLMER